MTTTRRILFLSGTRADFGKIKPLIASVKATPGLEYDIFATGMHMLARYGRTVKEIRDAGFDRIHPFVNQDGAVTSQMDLVLATTVQGLGHYVREATPDLLVVHGDRIEALAGAIVGSLNNILVAHIEGGEISGTIDDLIRHAVTKLSHLHFVANDEARDRLVQLGEQPSSIFVIGSPDIDVMLGDTLPTMAVVRERYEIPFDEHCILMFHPVTTEHDQLEVQSAEIVRAAVESGRNFVVVYPNNDFGADIILRHYKTFEGNPRFRMLPSMRFEYFLSLLKHAQAIVGNSSAGIREAPVYGVPTVNVGTRQSDRFIYPSIVNVPAEAGAIKQVLTNLPSGVAPSQHFGDGRSAEQFLEVLRSDAPWQTSRQKRFHNITPVAAPR